MRTVTNDGTRQGISRGRLPTGPHGIPRGLIEQNQRERVIEATAEVAAERGYCGMTVRDVVRRAGVSSSTFYELFGGLEECMHATFDELHGRLMEQIDVACEETADPQRKPRVALRRSLELFAADAPSARLLTVEILGTGPGGARAQHQAIARTAERLGIGGVAGRGVVGMISTLVAERVIAAEADAIPGLEDELEPVLCAFQSSNLG